MKVFCLLILVVASCNAYTIEVLKGPFEYLLGESPHWDEEKQELIFVDIEASIVHRYIPATGEFYKVTVDGRVSPAIPIAGSANEYLLGVIHEFKILEWDGITPEPSNLTTIDFLSEIPTTRINDGKCDPSGRLIAGTYDESGGSGGNLYRLDTNGRLAHLESNISISNGLAWSSDNSTMFYVDSPTLHVYAYDYDIQTGQISNRRSIFYMPDHGLNQGTPDGMTIDSDGNLWVAVFAGSTVLNINPTTGELLGQIDFSAFASQITSAAFGGTNLDVLYVTSAALDVSPLEPFAGSLFAVHDLGVTGAGAGVPFIKNF